MASSEIEAASAYPLAAQELVTVLRGTVGMVALASSEPVAAYSLVDRFVAVLALDSHLHLLDGSHRKMVLIKILNQFNQQINKLL